jgi:group I intron endonuclease
MQKHGIENFVFEVIEECIDDSINEREIYWIAYFDSTNRNNGYNLSRGGEEIKEETRRKLSEALKGNKHCVGRVVSEETRKKLCKGGRTTTLRRFGPKQESKEIRTCACGNQFEVIISNRKRERAKATCSKECAAKRILSEKTREKISQSLASKSSLRDQIREEAISRLRAGQFATQIAIDLNVSYKTICRIRRDTYELEG